MEKVNWKWLFFYSSSKEPRRNNQPVKQRYLIIIVVVVNLCPEYLDNKSMNVSYFIRQISGWKTHWDQLNMKILMNSLAEKICKLHLIAAGCLCCLKLIQPARVTQRALVQLRTALVSIVRCSIACKHEDKHMTHRSERFWRLALKWTR